MVTKQNFSLACRKDRSSEIFTNFLHVLASESTESETIYHVHERVEHEDEEKESEEDSEEEEENNRGESGDEDDEEEEEGSTEKQVEKEHAELLLDWVTFTLKESKKEGDGFINFITNVNEGKEVNTNGKYDVQGDYNKNMGSVDQMDRTVAHRKYPHKHLKWTHAVFFWLLTATLNNCWIIYCMCNNSKEDFDTFLDDKRIKGGRRHTT